jgi:hypothetical protein
MIRNIALKEKHINLPEKMQPISSKLSSHSILLLHLKKFGSSLPLSHIKWLLLVKKVVSSVFTSSSGRIKKEFLLT